MLKEDFDLQIIGEITGPAPGGYFVQVQCLNFRITRKKGRIDVLHPDEFTMQCSRDFQAGDFGIFNVQTSGLMEGYPACIFHSFSPHLIP